MTKIDNPAASGVDEGIVHAEGTSWVATEVVDYLSRRTASREAAFFIRHLAPGMSILDCGCGPGSITVELAQIVSPGLVAGIDREPAQIANAKRRALSADLLNTDFRVGNVYEIPYPDASFDAVLAHAVLQHLSEPMRALKEIHRVLKPNGLIGLREEDRNGDVIYPMTPILQEAHALTMRLWQQVGGDPYFPSRYREALREAGFIQVEMSASCEYCSNPNDTRAWAATISHYLEEAELADLILELGWADRPTLDAMVSAYKEWGEHPDAFWAETWCEAVGRKGDTQVLAVSPQ
jgi:ubiquinone/menaquinone biosynthesis C-methylase UbiE